MTIRVHGAVGADRLGYFQGSNALVTVVSHSVAANAANRIDFGETGVVTEIDDFKSLFGILPVVNISTLDAEVRTFNGVEMADDAAYIAAYAQQKNLQMVVDSIQQRSVIIATSASVASVADDADDLTAAVLTNFIGDYTGGAAIVVAAGDIVTGITFLVERVDTLSQHEINRFGQLTGTIDADHFLDEMLNDIAFLKADGTAFTAADSSLRFNISRSLPSFS